LVLPRTLSHNKRTNGTDFFFFFLRNNQHTREYPCWYAAVVSKTPYSGGSVGRLNFHPVLGEVENDGAKAAGPAGEPKDE